MDLFHQNYKIKLLLKLTLKSVMDIILKILKEKLNYKLSPIFKEKREGEVENIVLDNSELKAKINYKSFININEGIEKIINF